MKRSHLFLATVLLAAPSFAEEPSVSFTIGHTDVRATISGVDEDYLGSGEAKDLIECVTQLLKFGVRELMGSGGSSNPNVCLEE